MSGFSEGGLNRVGWDWRGLVWILEGWEWAVWGICELKL